MRNPVRTTCLLLAGLGCTLPLAGCLVGYSSRGGGFIFPGGIGLVLLLLLLFLLMRRR